MALTVWRDVYFSDYDTTSHESSVSYSAARCPRGGGAFDNTFGGI